MEQFTSIWNLLLSLGTIGLMVACIVLIYALCCSANSFGQKTLRFVTKYILWIGFGVSAMSVASSLVYSEIIGYAPCLFCWWTRVWIYPQAFLFGKAIKLKDMAVLNYTLILTSIGLVFSLYHVIIESIQYSPLPCAVGGVSCLTRYVYEFGFITIPVMGLVGLLTLFLATLVAKKGKKSTASTSYPQ